MSFRDLSFVLSIKNYNSSLLNFDLLQGSGIIPNDWMLLQKPEVVSGSSQVFLNNGIKIIAKDESLSFIEPVVGNIEDLQITSVVQRYIHQLPNLKYQSISINPRYFALFEKVDDLYRFFSDQILHPVNLQSYGVQPTSYLVHEHPMSASVNLVYPIKRCQLSLTIAQTQLKMHEIEQPAVMFSGNYVYKIPPQTANFRVKTLYKILEQWTQDWAEFHLLLHEQYLGDSNTNVLEKAAG